METSFWITTPHSLEWVMCGPQVLPMLMENEARKPKTMTNTTAKAQLLDLLIEPLKGCKGLYSHRQNLMQRVMHMPDLEVRDYLDRFRASHFPST